MMENHGSPPMLKIADSTFVGFMKKISCKSDALEYFKYLKKEHPSAAHIPSCWILNRKEALNKETGFDDDGEPESSVGPFLVQELKRILKATEDSGSYVLVIVRHFGHQLLGVTCGRLSQCYQSIAILTLHRYFNDFHPLHQDFTSVAKEELTKPRYGLGSGDCELIPNIIKDVDDFRTSKDDHPSVWIHHVISELEFGGFRGHQKEELPRLQNLQADIASGVVPVYRYPGNYRGDEWETYQWSPISLKIKEAVEKNLIPLVDQVMNHCVTNYYRNGDDFIGHHSDKNLDLDKGGVIISVSLGDERILELKRRASPNDTTRINLPHGSMLVLGPYTNKYFTHSILTKEGSSQPRISLTYRRVLTYLDQGTGRLFGEGVTSKSLSELQKNSRTDTLSSTIGLGAISAALFHSMSKSKQLNMKPNALIILSTSLLGLSYLALKRVRLMLFKQREENEARISFSKASVHGTKYI